MNAFQERCLHFDALMSSDESVASHAYRVFSVRRHCSSSRFHRDGVSLCTLRAECWGASFRSSGNNQDESASRKWWAHAQQEGEETEMTKETKNAQIKSIFQLFFLTVEDFCVYFCDLVQLSPLHKSIWLSNLIRYTWFDPAHQPLLSTLPYILDIMH